MFPCDAEAFVYIMFDTEKFINEISLRPALWQMSSKDYSNRDLKCKLWIETGQVMVTTGNNYPQKKRTKKVSVKLFIKHRTNNDSY